MKPSIALIAITIWAPLSASAYKGEVVFSPEEIQRHQAGLSKIMEVSAACLKSDLDFHQRFFDKWKVSPFFGDRGSFARRPNPDGSFRTTTVEERKQYLRSFTVKDALFTTRRFNEEQIDYYLKITRPTSCVGLVLKCMGQGFEAAGQQDLWLKLKEFTMNNAVGGGALQEGLQNLGWRLMYWNPDTSQNAIWDAEEERRTPDNKDRIWGKHVWNWETVKKSRMYLYNRVDDLSSLVNFGEQVPHAVKSVPFFVGVAHMGYHVFPGSFGQIIEGHSTRQLNDRQTVETSPFNPLANGGGPRGFYRSGVIAIPPGYFDPDAGMAPPKPAPGARPQEEEVLPWSPDTEPSDPYFDEDDEEFLPWLRTRPLRRPDRYNRPSLLDW